MWHHLQVYFIFVGGGVKKSSNKKARAAVQMHECSGLVKFKNPCGHFSDTSNFFSMEVVSRIFSTTSMFFRHHLQVFFVGGGVKKVQIKKSQSGHAKCTSALAWSVKFKFFSNPNVWNGTSWCLTTWSKKLNLVKFKKFFDPNVWNGTSWSLTTLDFFSSPELKNGTSWSLVTWSNKKGRALSLSRENSAFERAAAASQPDSADDLSSWQDKSSSQRAESQ